MADNHKTGRVQDYTAPFLVAFCVVLFCVLGFVWALYGFVPALAAAYLLDQLFRRKPLHHNGIKPTDWAGPRTPE
jgi:hypothetical protein